MSVHQSVSIHNDSELGYPGSCLSTLSNENAAFPCLATLCSITDMSCACDTIALEHSVLVRQQEAFSGLQKLTFHDFPGF